MPVTSPRPAWRGRSAGLTIHGPSPGIALFGTVAAGGGQTLVGATLERGDNVLGVALSLGAGIIPIAAPTPTTLS
ncbi:hypothetical protein [Streptomyces sp. NPDC004266]|uniref:hypothetical protein n=1 Tax=Streptomyces sp. NPDC004266 TaxID=3364693 RepID=UPI00367CDA94